MNVSDLESAASFLFDENAAGVAVFVFFFALGFVILGWIAGFASRLLWLVGIFFLSAWIFLNFHLSLPLPAVLQAAILDAKQALGL